MSEKSAAIKLVDQYEGCLHGGHLRKELDWPGKSAPGW
jgi:hypothetical protein